MTDRDRNEERNDEWHGSVMPPADPDASDEEIMSRLGGRTLGEAGTTGGTTVGAEMQAEELNATVGGDRQSISHGYDPGMGGRTTAAGLGSNMIEEVTGREQLDPDEVADRLEATHDIEGNKILPDDIREAVEEQPEYRSRRPTGREVPLDNQAEQ